MIGSVHIRHALRTDVREIARVHVDAVRVAYRNIYADEHLKTLSADRMADNWLHEEKGHLVHSEYVVFVALIDDKIIGFADIGPTAFKAVAELYAIYLDSAYIGKGVGSSLFRKCIESAKQRGFQAMKLTVLSANYVARVFYERMQGHALPETEIEIVTGGTRAKIITYAWPDLSVVRNEGRGQNHRVL
ncbi:GNAT family N-acetyltransferase [Methylosinus sp. Ce-a6]|uniref:GNAT family N-acetyltransferase n=1 Tax=Methylosinus sp. Ce-a6 TaxID=2172005 RepID=UPI00135B7D5F|nr:GNAT family N-acetyltransferase [Methylosinus sp. Ce-a6]